LRQQQPSSELLQLFGLCGFAAAAPIFDLLARNPEILIAHHATSAEIIWLAIGLLALPPLLGWGLEFAAGRLNTGARGRLHWLLIGALASLSVLPPLERALSPPISVALTLVAALGLLTALAGARMALARSLLSMLAVGPMIFAAVFLSSDSIARVRAASGWSLPDYGRVAADTPLIIVVFDAFPLVSLLDAHESIDAERFPNFAALAEKSTWFRNTTAASDVTQYAVPAILTGRRPDPSRLPVIADHPENLFSWLRGSYSMLVHEPRTMLMPTEKNLPTGPSAAPRSALLADLAILYAHLITPTQWKARLPSVGEDWKNFGRWLPKDASKLARGGDYGHRPAQFRSFNEAVEPCARSCLSFLHIIFPHTPWSHLPSGQAYPSRPVPGIDEGRWQSEAWWVVQGYQRHLFQAVAADALLGELLETLRRKRLFGRSLIVVTADHGSSYWPNQNRRLLESHEHPEDILRVPLFVKTPHQPRADVDDRRAETIDVLPTIADALGVELPWSADGTSLLSADFPNRDERVAYTNEGQPLRFAGDLPIRDSLDRKLSIFGPGVRGLYTFGPYAALLGRPASDRIGPAAAPCRLQLASELFADGPGQRPVRILGLLRCEERPAPRPQLAIAVDGVVEAVAPAFETRDGDWLVSAFLPEEAFGERGELESFLVGGPPERPELSPVPLALEPVWKEIAASELRDPSPSG
jgi:hypothetical protein